MWMDHFFFSNKIWINLRKCGFLLSEFIIIWRVFKCIQFIFKWKKKMCANSNASFWMEANIWIKPTNYNVMVCQWYAPYIRNFIGGKELEHTIAWIQNMFFSPPTLYVIYWNLNNKNKTLLWEIIYIYE